MQIISKRSLIKTIISLCLIMIFFALLMQCKNFDNPAVYTPPDTGTVTYTESTADFPNPERGFYHYTETNAGSYTPLDADQLEAWRTSEQQVDGGDYQIYSTLVFRYFVLDGFTDKALSSTLLDEIQADFDAARTAGVKLIPRFTYTITSNAGSCAEGSICPPYGDAPKEIVLEHIGQLKSILQDNADVIACLQMGFIGLWGENYYTDYFGDASQNGAGKVYDSNWQDRIDVLTALLDALPTDRMVQVRYPQLKQKLVYGIDAATSSAALTESEAFTGTYKARIGMHNDCFLSSSDDYGTYDDYGTSSTPRQSANSVLRAYAEEDNKYVAVGGETCDDTYSPENDCETAGMAQTEMNNLHYSYLNSAYNNDVNNDWVSGGCMDNIKKNLGYRFVLRSGIFPGTTVKAGYQFKITLNIENVGYASPFNERPFKLIMRSQSDGQEFSYDLTADVRTWYTGDVQVTETVVSDVSMSAGKYDLLLYLPDNYSSIAARPEYAIRLANEDVWEEDTGYNKLLASVIITK